MITITYSAEGTPNADLKSEALALELYNTVTEYHTSTDGLITAFGLHVVEGTIPHDNVKIVFNSMELTFNKKGELSDWPQGFCDSELNMLQRKVNLRRKEERK